METSIPAHSSPKEGLEWGTLGLFGLGRKCQSDHTAWGSSFKLSFGYSWGPGDENNSEHAALYFGAGTMTHGSPSLGLPVGRL
jgi:hypothetical protein